MLALHVLMVAAAVTAADDTVLLEFSADWCQNCRTMAPTVERVTAGGYPLRKINVDRDRALAQQFRVEGVPCYVMLAGGREVDRVTGATSYDRLLRMYQAAQQSQMPSGPQIRGQSPEGPSREREIAGAGREAMNQMQAMQPVPAAAPAMPSPAADPRAAMTAASQKALQAAVRLRIEEPNGNSYGTGTVIDVHGEEALVLTCGHVFRDSQGKGRITADFFGAENRGSVEGHLIGYDLDRDIGLVSVRLTSPVAPMPVAPAGFRTQKGDPVFTVGCDKGGEPSVRASYVSAVNKYLGSPNVEVKGAPIDGRSGGGLYSADGYLIGVCNAADREGDEGLYAALATVHSELDRTNLSFVYRKADAAAPLASAPATTSSPAAPLAASPSPPTMPDTMPANVAQQLASSPAAMAALAGANGRGETEVICIVRSNDPRENSRVIVLPKPSTDFLDRLSREQQKQGTDLTSLHTSPGAGPVPGAFPSPGQSPVPSPILRGQSPQR